MHHKQAKDIDLSTSSATRQRAISLVVSK